MLLGPKPPVAQSSEIKTRVPGKEKVVLYERRDVVNLPPASRIVQYLCDFYVRYDAPGPPANTRSYSGIKMDARQR